MKNEACTQLTRGPISLSLLQELRLLGMEMPLLLQDDGEMLNPNNPLWTTTEEHKPIGT